MIFEKIQLESDEKIISIIRRHWFYLFKKCLFIAVLVLSPLGALIALQIFAKEYADTFFTYYAPHALFLYSFWVLIHWMMLASTWTNYYLDVICITNRRVIKIDQVAFFNRKTGSFRLEKIQDVNVEVKGIIETLLDFGTIHPQTASEDEEEEFKLRFLPKPQEIKAVILKAADEQMQKGYQKNEL